MKDKLFLIIVITTCILGTALLLLPFVNMFGGVRL